jgi:hypothetical protein
MPADISLFSDAALTHPVATIALSEVTIEGPLGMGSEVPVYGSNTGDTAIRNVSVGLSGDGARNVQLATLSGVWADGGQEILVVSGTLLPGESFQFRARAVYTIDDVEGRYPFEFVVRGMSVAA